MHIGPADHLPPDLCSASWMLSLDSLEAQRQKGNTESFVRASETDALKTTMSLLRWVGRVGGVCKLRKTLKFMMGSQK